MWKQVRFAADCPPCEMCGEPVCPECNTHYADCECPGPCQDDEYEYRDVGDEMYAKRKTE